MLYRGYIHGVCVLYTRRRDLKKKKKEEGGGFKKKEKKMKERGARAHAGCRGEHDPLLRRSVNG